MAVITSPIWQNVEISLGTEDVIRFEIERDDGYIIYSGVAHKAPGQTNNTIIPNEICANYLKQVDPPSAQSILSRTQMIPAEEIKMLFYINKLDGAVVDIPSVEFTLNYDYGNLAEDYYQLQAPIGNTITRDAVLSTTMVGPGDEVEVLLWDANDNEEYYQLVSPEPFTAGGNVFLTLDDIFDFAAQIGFKITEIGFFNYAPNKYSRYRLVDGCTRYTLFYVNALGGWDFLPLAVAKEVQTIDRLSFNKGGSQARGIVNYQNDIVQGWRLGTHWLTDEGARNMHHLIGSTNVWLFDREDAFTAQWYPVTITDTSFEVKNYINQGANMVRYDINVQLAQDRIRR